MLPLFIGPAELAIVLVVVLIVFGPGKLPQVAKSLGDGLRQFKQAASGQQSSETPASKESDPS